MNATEELEQYLKTSRYELGGVFVDPTNDETTVEQCAQEILDSLRRLNAGELKPLTESL